MGWIGDSKKDEDGYEGIEFDENGFPTPNSLKAKYESLMDKEVDMESVERAVRIESKAVELAKTLARDDLRELFLAVLSGLMIKSHCEECFRREQMGLMQAVAEMPLKATFNEQKKYKIPHGEGNKTVDGEEESDGTDGDNDASDN